MPLIIRLPKGAPGLPAGTTAGAVCNRAVCLTDLFRTPKSYGVINPARTKRQQTRPGAVWEIRSQDGRRLGDFIIGDRTAKAIIPDDE